MKDLTLKERILEAMEEIKANADKLMKRFKKMFNKAIDDLDLDEDSDEFEIMTMVKKSMKDATELSEASFELAILQQQQINEIHELMEKQNEILERIAENTNRIK